MTRHWRRVPLDRLDAGSGWDGYHLYEYGLEHRIRSRTPKGGPWWVYFYAPATDSAYVVPQNHFPPPRHSGAPVFLLVAAGADELYLLHRDGVPASSTRGQGDPDAPGPGGLATVSFPWQRRRCRHRLPPAPAVD